MVWIRALYGEKKKLARRLLITLWCGIIVAVIV